MGNATDLYKKVSDLRYFGATSWDELGKYIDQTIELAKIANTSIYNLDLSNYKAACNKKGSKKSFEDIKYELKDTLLHMG